MFPLSAYSDVSTERFPAGSPSLPACHLPTVLTLPVFSHFSPFFALLLSPLGSRPVVVFYLFHCNLSLSPIKSNANPRPLPSCFSLAWPLFALPSALASIQPHTLHLICLVPLTLSSFHAYCSLALFLPWSGTVELNMTCSLQLLAMLNTYTCPTVFLLLISSLTLPRL